MYAYILIFICSSCGGPVPFVTVRDAETFPEFDERGMPCPIQCACGTRGVPPAGLAVRQTAFVWPYLKGNSEPAALPKAASE
jgi:hypothetical protein